MHHPGHARIKLSTLPFDAGVAQAIAEFVEQVAYLLGCHVRHGEPRLYVLFIGAMARCTAPSVEGHGLRALFIASRVLAIAAESASLVSSASSAILRYFLMVGRDMWRLLDI